MRKPPRVVTCTRGRHGHATDGPDISCIVPVHSRFDLLDRCLAALHGQSLAAAADAALSGSAAGRNTGGEGATQHA